MSYEFGPPSRSMLSYRHGFHAGNHADVLKHSVLVFLLDYLSRKNKPWQFVDTHAGAARYDLDSEWARKNAEHESGISTLWPCADLPPLLAAYVAHVRRLNPDGTLRSYPGSPQLALQCARREDRLRLFELHPNESEVLRSHCAEAGSRVQIKAQMDTLGSRPCSPTDPTRSDSDRPLLRRKIRLRAGRYRAGGGTQALRHRHLHGVVSAAAATRGPPLRSIPGAHGEGGRHRLAKRFPVRARPLARWFRHARQRGVHRQSALDSARCSAASPCISRVGPSSGQRGHFESPLANRLAPIGEPAYRSNAFDRITMVGPSRRRSFANLAQYRTQMIQEPRRILAHRKVT